MPLEEFLNLPREKQRSILGAAVQEFARCGYDLASTNRIVAIAGISKGVLFKYFRSKENLFLFTVGRFLAEASASAGELPHFKDFFAFLEYSMEMDIQSMSRDADVKSFMALLARMHLEPRHPVYAKALADYAAGFNGMVDAYCDSVDASLLRDGLTIDDLKKVLHFLGDSMRATFHKDPNRFFAESAQVLREARMLLSVVRAGVFK